MRTSRITLAAAAVLSIALTAPAEARRHHAQPTIQAGALVPDNNGRWVYQAREPEQTYRAQRPAKRAARHRHPAFRLASSSPNQEITLTEPSLAEPMGTDNQLSARRHYARRGGACDGFHRCRCGTTTARYHGLPYNYNGLNLKMARSYYAFPRTSFGIGAVGVRPHHVLTVVGGSDCRSATVHDDAGTYQRNVCGMTFVSVGGGGMQTASYGRTRRAHKSSRRGGDSQYVQVESAVDIYSHGAIH